MNWNAEEIEALEWLVTKNASLQTLENVLYERTSQAIIEKIEKLDLNNLNKYTSEYHQKPEIKKYHKKYYQKKIAPCDLERITQICSDLNSSQNAETAVNIYKELRGKNVNFQGENHCLYSIINYALILDMGSQKIDELSKLAGVRPITIAKTRERYKKILNQD